MLYDCEALAYPRFHHLGHYFMELSEHNDIPIRKVLCLIRSLGLTAMNRRGSTIILEVAVQGLNES
jgi:hypothetical protein